MNDRVTEFAEDIVKNKYSWVGEHELLSCKRHLDDLEKQNTDEFPYVWNVKQANKIIRFSEKLTLAEGYEKKPLVLAPFQAFILGSWNGWLKADTRYRRFKTSYTSVARQNGKSLINSIPEMYYGNFTGYQYPQIYCTATKEDQARIVLRECYKFINSDTEFSGDETHKGLFTIQDYKSTIQCNLTHGNIKALGRDTKSIDGFRPYFASVDEYHKHKTADMYNQLLDGCKELKDYLISVITTAGDDPSVPCKELDEYCIQILKGVIKDDTQFVFICRPDKDDDPWIENTWRKANPIWNDAAKDNLQAYAIKAQKQGGEKLRDFMIKSLNIWYSATDDSFLNIDDWNQCATDLTIDDMKNKTCVVGMDLSDGGDLTSIALEFKLSDTEYYLFHHSFMPEKRLQQHIQTDKAPYDVWVREGLITLTETFDGLMTDYKYIISYLKNLQDKYKLKYKYIAYDPHGARYFVEDLENLGWPTVAIDQHAKTLDDATKNFRIVVEQHKMYYDKKDKLLTFSAYNAKLTKNSVGEIKVRKNYAIKRIDPIYAALDAHNLQMNEKGEYNYDPNKFADDDVLDTIWGNIH